MALTVDKLFYKNRFSGDNKVLQFLLFFPFGVILTGIRIILALILWIASIILPDKSGVRQMLSTLACWTFGVFVKLKGIRDRRSSVLVANYVSCLDSLAAAHVLGTISLRKWKMPPFFASTLGIRNAAQFIRKQYFADSTSKPILLQPEGGPTNGKALLKFTDWPFPIGNRIQPIAITVERQMTRVCVRKAWSRDGFPWLDALWFLCAPSTVYTLQALPPMERGDDDDAAFAARISRAISDALQIEATEFRWEEAMGTSQRGQGSSQRSVLSGTSGHSGQSGQSGQGISQSGGEMARMVRQVKEVLPAVPERDVLRDLARTRSVDVTITNFLEGITPYTPEPEQSLEPKPGPSHASNPPKYIIPVPTGVFPKSAKERQISFQDRKAQMIAEARKRYIEKHGLNVALNG